MVAYNQLKLKETSKFIYKEKQIMEKEIQVNGKRIQVNGKRVLYPSRYRSS